MSDHEALAQLLGAYLNQDWSDDYVDIWAGIDEFISDERILAGRVREEVNSVLVEYPSEAALRVLLTTELHSGYWPGDGPFAHRDWLREVADYIDSRLVGE